MANKTYALEWIQFAIRNLITAQHLFSVNHFTDIIGIELQQSIEKTLKSLLAYQNKRIPKEHDLVKLYFTVENKLTLNEEEIINLKKATNYFKEDRYPNPNYFLPPREEIKEILEFTENLFEDVCKILDIDKQEIIIMGGLK